ncbi:MAG: hypothetical protein H0V82_08190 [Candidatus Protochlamydia sp.]|nr:hypothetical protein [Candidatus Protochlamydia sp.]
MTDINLNSDKTYSKIGRFPVAQQILGSISLLKNTIGLIKDIAIRLLTRMSTENYNAKLMLEIQKGREKSINENRENIGNLIKLADNRKISRCALYQPPTAPTHTFTGHLSYIRRESANRNDNQLFMYWLGECLLSVEPVSDRIQNIALGLITILPGAATIYHWSLLKYYFIEQA